MSKELKALITLYTMSEATRIRAVYYDTTDYQYGRPPHVIAAEKLGIPPRKVKQLIAA